MDLYTTVTVICYSYSNLLSNIMMRGLHLLVCASLIQYKELLCICV